MTLAKILVLRLLACVACTTYFASELTAQRLSLSPDRFDFTIDADTVVTGGAAIRIVASSANVPFQENLPFRANAAVTGSGPRFLIVSPANGTTPANGALALDPQVVPFLAPGAYTATFSYSVGPAGTPPAGGGFFNLRVRTPPPPIINAALNGATLKSSIAPGTFVSIFGTNLGSPALSSEYNEFGVYPTTHGNTSVTFNGIEAPLTYVSNTQINAIVPHEMAGQTVVRVVVKHHGQQSPEFVLPLQDTGPGIFTTSQNGNGQGAILQTLPRVGFPVTLNGVANPVEKGGTIIVYATGAGLWNQDVRSGQVVFVPQASPEILPRAPVSIRIGGRQATLLYAGAAPNTAGVLQVNAIVPDDADSGAQLIELTIGQNTNSQQQVTVAIR